MVPVFPSEEHDDYIDEPSEYLFAGAAAQTRIRTGAETWALAMGPEAVLALTDDQLMPRIAALRFGVLLQVGAVRAADAPRAPPEIRGTTLTVDLQLGSVALATLTAQLDLQAGAPPQGWWDRGRRAGCVRGVSFAQPCDSV